MSRVNILLFAFPAVVVLLLPLLCWLVGYWFREHDFSLYLLCVGAQRSASIRASALTPAASPR